MEYELTVEKNNGIYTLKNPFFQIFRESTFLGKGGQQKQHGSGPLLVKQLKNNPLAVDWKLADVVYVYDFCIKYPTNQSNIQEYQDLLQLGYDRIIQTDQWKKYSGKNFLFIVSHPMEQSAEKYRCDENKTANAIYAVTEWKLSCNIRTHNILIPYVTNDIIKNDKKFEEREKTMCFLGNTQINGYRKAGIRLRYYLKKYLENLDDDIFVKNHHDLVIHEDLMKIYQNCKFCFVISGDTLSSRRLGEVILGGCIPVFIGPPFHNIWFEQFIHYDDLSIYLYIKNREWDFDPKRKKEPKIIEFVVPGEAKIFELKNLTDIPQFLRNFPEEIAKKKYESVIHYQSAFEYVPNAHGYPSALDLVMKHSCNVVERVKQRKLHDKSAIFG